MIYTYYQRHGLYHISYILSQAVPILQNPSPKTLSPRHRVLVALLTARGRATSDQNCFFCLFFSFSEPRISQKESANGICWNDCEMDRYKTDVEPETGPFERKI